MQQVCSVARIRAAEQAWFDAHPGGDLMGRAAEAVADEAARLLLPVGWYAYEPAEVAQPIVPRVLVVAGPGNNAGDALFAAAGLPRRVCDVEILVWSVAGHTHADGLAAALAAGARHVDADLAATLAGHVDLVIDGVSGLGGRPGLAAPVAAVADAARAAGTAVLAVDLPSGLVADSHEAHPCFHAEVTVTFIARKLAHVAEPAASECGRVVCVDIGVRAAPEHTWLVTAADLHSWYPWPGPTSDKYSRGVVGLDTGSPDYPGAAVLGVSGALHAGAGMVRYLGPARRAVLAAFPSVVSPPDSSQPGQPSQPGRVQAWVCGSGWPDADSGRFARRPASVPVVVDAGALLNLSISGVESDRAGDLAPGSLLTPHAGELARLLGVERAEVTADPVGHVRRAARLTGVCVLLKGSSQYCAAPDGSVLIVESGPAWTATAGSGDVLAGVAGAMLAAGLDAQRAGALAAALQVRAARVVEGPYPPDAVARCLPDAVMSLSQPAEEHPR